MLKDLNRTARKIVLKKKQSKTKILHIHNYTRFISYHGRISKAKKKNLKQPQCELKKVCAVTRNQHDKHEVRCAVN